MIMYECAIIETPCSIIIYNVNLCVLKTGVMVGGSAEPLI